MNSLSFISRQFDVFASSSTTPCAPPSTPTSEKDQNGSDSEGESGYSRRNGVAPPHKRTRTWSARSFLIPSPAQTQQAHMHRQLQKSPSRTRKRSGSTPANMQSRTDGSVAMLSPIESKEDPSVSCPNPSAPHRRRFSSVHEPPSSPANSTPPPSSPHSTKPFPRMRSLSPSLLRRTYVVRMVLLVVQWLCATWEDITRRQRPSMIYTQLIEDEPEAETSGDEKDSDDDITAAACRAAKAANLRSSASIDSLQLMTRACSTSKSSKSPSPLSQSTVLAPALPILNLVPPPDSPPTDIERSSTPEAVTTNIRNGHSQHRAGSPSLSNAGANSPKPPFYRQKTLVLDLDETLIHSTTRPLYPSGGGDGLLGLGGLVGYGRTRRAGHMVEVVMNGRSTLYHVYKRPFVDYFLRKVSGWYTLVIFTASMQEYADPVIDWLDAGRGIIARRLFRESCTQLPNGSYTKDLSIVESDLSRICLVDNSPVSYNINQANGIPIEGWTHDPNDEALLDLLPVLDSLRFTSDVRRVLGIRGF